jgi:hypothetical protein
MTILPFDISDYVGNDNVRVKWTFFGTTESAWAIDNITISVRPYSDQLEWTDGLGEPGEYIIRDRLEAVYPCSYITRYSSIWRHQSDKRM